MDLGDSPLPQSKEVSFCDEDCRRLGHNDQLG